MDRPAARPLAPATDQTGHMYRDSSGASVLFLVPAFLEYAAPGITIRTEWSNIIFIEQTKSGPFLHLAQPAALNVKYDRNTPIDDRRFRTVPLAPFGYPTNSSLHADLLRFAPHLQRKH